MKKTLIFFLIITSFILSGCSLKTEDKEVEIIEHREISQLKEVGESEKVKVEDLMAIYLKDKGDSLIIFSSYYLNEMPYELNIEYIGNEKRNIKVGDIINIVGEFKNEKRKYESKELGTEYEIHFVATEIEKLGEK